MLKWIAIPLLLGAVALAGAAGIRAFAGGGDESSADDREARKDSSRDRGRNPRRDDNDERRRDDERERSDERIPEIVVVRGTRIDLSKLSAKARSRVQILLQQMTAAQTDLQAAERDVDQARLNIASARGPLQQAEVDLNAAVAEMRAAQADYHGQDAAYRAMRDHAAHVDPYMSSVTGTPHSTPVPSPPSPSMLLRPRIQVQTAQQRYNLAMQRAGADVKAAQTAFENSKARVEQAKVMLLRAESDIIDLVNRG